MLNSSESVLSNTVRSLAAAPPLGVSWYHFLCSDFDVIIFAYVLNDFEPKKLFPKKNKKIIPFLLESSETHFDLVASKIRAKLINLVIYSDILVNFLRKLSTNQPYLKNENEKNRKIDFS